jgi:hypothetical protein
MIIRTARGLMERRAQGPSSRPFFAARAVMPVTALREALCSNKTGVGTRSFQDVLSPTTI